MDSDGSEMEENVHISSITIIAEGRRIDKGAAGAGNGEMMAWYGLRDCRFLLSYH